MIDSYTDLVTVSVLSRRDVRAGCFAIQAF